MDCLLAYRSRLWERLDPHGHRVGGCDAGSETIAESEAGDDRTSISFLMTARQKRDVDFQKHTFVARLGKIGARETVLPYRYCTFISQNSHNKLGWCAIQSEKEWCLYPLIAFKASLAT